MNLKPILITLIVICAFAYPATAATELITNGDFSNGLSGWTDDYGATGDASGLISTENGGVKFSIYADYTGGSAYAQISQTVSGITATAPFLTFDVTLLEYGTGGTQYPPLIVYVDGTEFLRIQPAEMSTSGSSYSIDLTGLPTGIHTFTFKSEYTLQAGYASTPRYSQFIIDDVSLIDTGGLPALAGPSISADVIESGGSITAEFSVDPGVPADATLEIRWGDGQSFIVQGITSTSTVTYAHTYTSTGTYTITAYAVNSQGYSNVLTIGTVEVVSLDFSATDYSGSAPLTVQFIPDSVGFTSYLWDFGDGGTSQEASPVHTYADAGIYTVTLTGYTASGKSYSETKTNLINTNPQSITFNATSYTEGDTALISWQLRSPDYSTYQYTLQVVPSDSLGNPTGQSIITPVTLSGTSGTHEWDTSGVSGYYTALIVRSGGSSSETLLSTTANVVSVATLTVNLAVSGVTYTNATTIILTSNGQTIASETTTSGQAQFTVPTGVYIVSATTAGYATQTATVNLVSATSIIIDFVSGASEGTYPSGSGQAYASTFITFRVQDSGTGKYLSGVQINAVGVEPTNPLEWMGNLFGGFWGENIIDTQLAGISDESGTVTFAMFPNVRYRLNITFGDYTESRSFQPSTLTGEYLISLPITESNKASASQKITTTVSATENKTIVASYVDSTQTTQSVTMTLYQVIDGNRTLIAENPAASSNFTQTFAPASPSGNSYILTITAQTASYGEVIREYGIDFPGPMIKIGNLPDAAYIVISFAILLLLGAVGTYITSRMYALVIVIVGLLLWWAGWLFAMGPLAGIALTICFVLAILYYIATGGQPQ